MSVVLSPERRPASLLAPGLLATVLCSVALACLQAAHGVLPREMQLSGAELLMFAGIFGAFGGFFSVLAHAVLIWVYGKASQPVNANFVRTLAVVALALGTTFVLQLVLVGGELALTGETPTFPVTNLSRYLGSDSVKLDAVNLVTIAIVYLGARRYLGYGAWAAGILAFLMLTLNVVGGVMI